MALTFKIILVGESGVGKTTYVKYLRTKEYEEKHVCTLGVEVHPFTLHTTKGPIRFNMWDTAGVSYLGGLREGYYLGGDGALVFCDHRNATRTKVSEWQASVEDTLPQVPIVLVNSKCEIGAPYPGALNISLETQQNIYEPLLEMARLLLHDFSIEMAE